MIKKIPTSQVRKGMFVHSLGCGRMESPLLRSRFLIRTDEQLRKLRELNSEAIEIDTSAGSDIDEFPPSAPVGVERLAAAAGPSQTAAVSVCKEISHACDIHQAARGIMRDALNDARQGELPDLPQIEQLVDDMSASLARNPGALLSLCRIRDAHEYTFLHSVSIGALMTAFCTHLKMDADTARLAGLGGMLHDIGKTRTPLHILNKPGHLQPEEFDIVRRHPSDGYRILSDTQGIHQIQLDIALQHHERLNGVGYPQGLPGKQIAPMAKIAAIVDVYNALTSERCYHHAIPPTEALRRLLAWAGSEFDHELVCKFIGYIGVYPIGSTVALASGRIAVVVEHNRDALRPVVVPVYNARTQRALGGERLDLEAGAVGSDERIIAAVDPNKYAIEPLSHLRPC